MYYLKTLIVLLSFLVFSSAQAVMQYERRIGKELSRLENIERYSVERKAGQEILALGSQSNEELKLLFLLHKRKQIPKDLNQEMRKILLSNWQEMLISYKLIDVSDADGIFVRVSDGKHPAVVLYLPNNYPMGEPQVRSILVDAKFRTGWNPMYRLNEIIANYLGYMENCFELEPAQAEECGKEKSPLMDFKRKPI